VNEVVFCFDGDSAGLKAAWKALELALPMMEKERSVKFLFLPDGEDPDSMVRKDGLEGFNQRIDTALSLSEFLMQGLQGRLSFPVDSIEGRQQLVSMAEPFVQSAHGLYQFLLAEGVANLVDLPTWRVEKQMNVKSGFAGFKNENTRPGKNKVDENSLSNIVTLPLKMLRLLVKRPAWSEIFAKEFVQDLVKSGERDYIALGGYIKILQANHYNAETAWQKVIDAGYENELNRVSSSEIPDDEVFLQTEFEVYVIALASYLDEKKLGQSGWSADEMLKLQTLVKSK